MIDAPGTSRLPTDISDVGALAAAFTVLVEAHPDAAYLLDLDGHFLAVNEVMCDRLQAQREQLIGRTYDDKAAAIDTRFVRERFARAVRGEPVQYEVTGTRTDGTTFLASVTNLPVKVGGEVAAVVGIAVDVTDRAEAIKRSRASEDLLRLAGRMARFGGWSVDARTKSIRLTDDTLRMFGVSTEQPLTNDIAWSLHAPGDREVVSALLERCLETGEPFDIESAMITTDGTRLTVRTIGEAERADNGSILRAHGAVWDITDFALERSRARDLEERLAASLRTISDGLVFLDTSWDVTFVNPTAEVLLGRSAAELVGTNLWQVYSSTLGTPFEAALRHAAETRESVIHQEWVDLTGRWVDVTIYPVDAGLVLHLRDATDDVTARERELDSARRLAEQAALLDIARDAIIVRGLDYRVRYWNRSAAELYEIPTAEALGVPVPDLIYGDLAEFEAAATEVMREGYWAGELVQQARSGRVIVADCRWQVLYDAEGKAQAVLCVNTDITAYRKEQEKRARSQRMESLGTFAGGIAHDLNNVLTPILMSAQLLAHDERDPDRLELLRTLESSVKRGAEMVRQVLAFARGVEGRRESVSMDALLDDVETYARDALPPSIVLNVTRPDTLASSTGDATQFMQVMINLLLNARDAMPDGGRLMVRASTEHHDTEVVSIGHVAEAGSYAVFTVEDTGHGMSSDVMAKVFEPFFTTKESGKGTGLGLSTTLAIVRSHGGFLQVYSEPGHGTSFRVGIPISASSPRPRATPPPGDSMPQGSGEHVLVVDDEEFVRRITCQTLEANGYRTTPASNGREAVDIVESGGDQIDLVVTDMMMPVMDGAATTAYLEEHHPEIPIIAASGLTSHGDSSGDVGMGVSRFLAKPYTTSLLLTAVRDTLQEHQSTRAVTE